MQVPSYRDKKETETTHPTIPESNNTLFCIPVYSRCTITIHWTVCYQCFMDTTWKKNDCLPFCIPIFISRSEYSLFLTSKLILQSVINYIFFRIEQRLSNLDLQIIKAKLKTRERSNMTGSLSTVSFQRILYSDSTGLSPVQ